MPYSYKVAGEPVELEVDPSVVAVRFNPAPASAKAAALMSAEIGSLSHRIDLPREGLSIVPTPAQPSPYAWSATSGHEKLMSMLDAQDAVASTLPVFRFGHCQAVANDRLIIGIAPEADATALIAKYGLEQISRTDERLLVRVPAAADIFALVAALDAEPETLYAEPDFVIVGRNLPNQSVGGLAALVANAAGSQYALAITRANDAHQVQQAVPAIRIAILDEGVDTSHPDLAMATIATYDAVEKDSYQVPNSWDGHGTACAGLALGSPATSGGVTGVAAGCSLVAVRIACREEPGGDWSTSPEKIADAIRWAWQVGRADVLSNSWGQQAPTNSITYALERARTEGRGGRGCVIVVAAGNTGDKVMFPANLPNVLTVGASNEYDEAKTWTSADKETHWASNIGPQVDVAAPGVHNLTTDIPGNGGYTTGNYAPAFNGTSSSTPLVAGACALLLSRRPDLREAEVRQTIVATADKVGQFAYEHGRNDYMGYGRLNVLAAINAV